VNYPASAPYNYREFYVFVLTFELFFIVRSPTRGIQEMYNETFEFLNFMFFLMIISIVIQKNANQTFISLPD